MTTKERREEYTTNVVRVLHPTSSRPMSPVVTEFDNNLDYLLEDLQASVSRPGSSLGQNVSSNYNTSTSRDVQFLAPSNQTTIMRERSLSPNYQDGRVYKTAKYEYRTTSAGQQDEMQQNINQLDTLLNDLKHERETSIDRDNNQISNVGIDSGLIEPGTTRVTKTVRTYTTNTSKPNVQRELVFESPVPLTNTSHQSRQRQRSPTGGYQKTIETTVSRDLHGSDDTGIYGGINRNLSPQQRTLSPNKNEKYSTASRTYNQYTTTTGNNEQIVPPNLPYTEIVSVDTTKGPVALQNVQLSDDILPKPTTKVTTTVRTYTYELPGDADPLNPNQSVVYKTDTLPGTYPERDQPPPTANQTILYRNETYNSSNTLDYPTHPHTPHRVSSPSPVPNQGQPPHRTIIYKNEQYNTNNVVDYPQSHPREPRVVSPTPPTTNKTIIYKTDTRETTTNRYPPSSPQNQYQQPRSPPYTGSPQYPYPQQGQPPNTTIIYKHDVTNTNVIQPPRGGPNYPPHHQPPPTQTVHYVQSPPNDGQPGSGPPVTTKYYYKHESSNTTNTQYGPPGSGTPSPYPNDRYPSNSYPTVTYPDESPRNTYPPNDHPYPHDPTTVTYKYTTHTTNNVHGLPHEREPLMQPAPFPTDGIEPSIGGQPPKRLDDLLATFGDTTPITYVDGPVHERYTAEKNIGLAKSAKQQQKDDDKQVALPSKNIAGPPVYYPPGHEMFAKKEEGMASYRAQGGYARSSGRYMYESESKSKSKSSSGGAVVPICLPLCCAMPCSIM